MSERSIDVTIMPGLQGAAEASGTVIVIDVFRAFTVASLAASRGASVIYPVSKIETALKLAETISNPILIGERHGKRLEGFDYGNSPTELATADVSGRALIHTTHAGTNGLCTVAENGLPTEAIFASAFVNADATVTAIRQSGATKVSIVPLGWAGETPTMEDSLCAHYLAAHLTSPDEAPHWSADDLAQRLRNADSSKRFFDPDQPWAPESDFDRCCEINRSSHALRLEEKDTSGFRHLSAISV